MHCILIGRVGISTMRNEDSHTKDTNGNYYSKLSEEWARCDEYINGCGQCV